MLEDCARASSAIRPNEYRLNGFAMSVGFPAATRLSKTPFAEKARLARDVRAAFTSPGPCAGRFRRSPGRDHGSLERKACSRFAQVTPLGLGGEHRFLAGCGHVQCVCSRRGSSFVDPFHDNDPSAWCPDHAGWHPQTHPTLQRDAVSLCPMTGIPPPRQGQR